MARRKQKQSAEPDLFLKLGMIGGALWLAGKLLGPLPEGTGDALGLTIVCVVGAAVVWFVVKVLGRITTRKSLLEKTRLATERQIRSLARRRAQLVQKDAYGKFQRDKWEKELTYFVAHHVEPILTAGECRALARDPEIARRIIDSRVEAAMLDQPPYMAFSDDMTPSEFETFCAEALNQAGWDARVTLQSRDQGVDVIAEKNRVRVVIQCKLYARPVGNKSVQEAAAARAHEQADYGVVVTNNRYTPAAEQLAATNGILLLHYRDLQDLEKIIRG